MSDLLINPHVGPGDPVKNGVTPKWVALENGTKDENLRFPRGDFILTHTHTVDGHNPAPL